MSVAVRSLYGKVARWWRGRLRDLEDSWEDMLDVLDVRVSKICSISTCSLKVRRIVSCCKRVKKTTACRSLRSSIGEIDRVLKCG